jgi:serine/threonine-protein kinase
MSTPIPASESAPLPLAPHPGGGEADNSTVPPAPAPEKSLLPDAPAAPAAAGGVGIPGYEVLSTLGRGGMGVVYQARQTKLGRVVALKMILAGAHAGPDDLARFRTEAQAIARLQHPNIVQIHEVGEHEGLPYFSLEFCARGSLEKKLAGTPLPPQEAAALVETLARAMQAAHDKGVIHRDLKPANVLLAEDGTPKVTDFGLARKLDEAGQTASGAVMGTPSYMAPEQAGGKRAAIGPAADVYALGAILYECLTGRPPFKAATSLDTVLQVISDDPVPPRALNRRLPRDLETVCLKCLRKEPRSRYASALELAEDLRRFLGGEPVRARPVGPWGRAVKWVRRKPMAAALAASLVLLVAGSAAVGLWLVQQRAERSAEQARREGDVEAALREAATLGEQARALTDNPAQWEATLAAALSTVKRAEALAGGEQVPVSPALTERLRALADELRAEEKDRQMGATLERIRLKQSELNFQDSQFAWREALPKYREAFQEYGLAPDAPGAAEAAAVVRARRPAVQAALVASLEQWLLLTDAGSPERRWLEDVLAAADPDDWHKQVRAAVLEKDRLALERLAEQGGATRQAPAAVVMLGQALSLTGARQAAVRLLRQAQLDHPDDLWVRHELAEVLFSGKESDLDEAIACYRMALAVRPRSPGVYLNLADALKKKGDLAAAAATLRKAIELEPRYAHAYCNLGGVLHDARDDAGAVTALHKAIELDPRDAMAYNNLALSLKAQGDRVGAIAAYRKALDLKPTPLVWSNLGILLLEDKDVAGAVAAHQKAVELDPWDGVSHYNLGLALEAKGDLPGAIAAYGKAVKLAPKSTLAQAAHQKATQEYAAKRGQDAKAEAALGRALFDKGDWEGAAAAYRRVIALDPKSAGSWNFLGVIAMKQDRPAEAAAAFKKFVEFEPDSALAHFNLGNALRESGDLAGAIAAHRRAVRLRPDHATSYCNLGNELRNQGEFAAALAELKRGHELGSRQPGWRYDSASWVRTCERQLELDGRLPAILKGEQRPADVAEQLEFAEVCACKGLYASAARLYAGAFAAKPEAADDARVSHRYAAAAAAARAGAGEGKDRPPADEAGRAELRRQALGWLRAELAGVSRHLGSGPAGRDFIQRTLRRWQRDPDLAALRDAAAMARLSAEEQASCKKLWAEVESLLGKAQEEQEK